MKYIQIFETGTVILDYCRIYVSYMNKIPLYYFNIDGIESVNYYVVERANHLWRSDYQEPTEISSIYELKFV